MSTPSPVPTRKPAPPHRHPLRGALRRLRRSRALERGAGTIEYIGLSVVVSVIIAGMALAPWMPQVESGVQKVICSVLSHIPGGGPGSCADVLAEPMEPEDYRPVCRVSDSTTSRGGNVEIAFVDLGGGTTLQVVEYSDGRTEVTMLDETSAGVSGDLGKLKLGDAAQIELGGDVNATYGNGDTWVFDSPEQAQEFVDGVGDYVDDWRHWIPFGSHFVDKPSDPRVTYDKFRMDAGGSANLGFENPFGGGDDSSRTERPGDDSSSSEGSGDPEGSNGSEDSDGDTPVFEPDLPDSPIDVGGNAEFGGEVIVKHDRGDDMESPDDDTSTFVTTIDMGADGQAQVVDEGPSGNANRSGTVEVTTNANGEIINITMRTTANADSGSGNNPTVNTTSLDVTTDEQRQVVTDWLADPTAFNPVTLVSDPPQPTEGGQTDPFQQLLYDRGLFSQEIYSGDVSSDGWDVGGKLFGIGLGYERTSDDQTLTLEEAYYYGPPDENGVRQRLENAPCLQ